MERKSSICLQVRQISVDQIQMPMDEVPTEKVESQQQTLAVAEGPLHDMNVTCKQCEVTFVFTKGEQRFFQRKKITQRDTQNAGNGFVKASGNSQQQSISG